MHFPSLLLEAFADFIVKPLSLKNLFLPAFLMLAISAILVWENFFSLVTQYLKEKI